MKTKKTNSSESIKAKLVFLGNNLDRDFNGLALEFAIERLIARLQATPKISKHLIFKGGFVMLKSYGSNRSTVDLDTSLQNLSIEESEALVRKIIATDWNDGVWMGSIDTEKLDHQTEYAGLRLIIRYSFGEPKIDLKKLGKLILDIGVADAITPAPIESNLHPLLGGEPISWRVYPIETIAAEKLHALVSLGSQNSRFKDIYDLTLLLPKCSDFILLKKAIKKTFAHRSTELPMSFSNFWSTLDKSTLKRSVGAVTVASGTIPKFDILDKTLLQLLKILD